MDPGRPRSPSERVALEVRRDGHFDLLHKEFERRLHERAVKIIELAWFEHSPFCLYLRNFGLGAQTSRREISKTSEPGEFLFEAETVDRMFDARFQSALADHVQARIPVVAVENPALDWPWTPRLRITDPAWQPVVADLIAAADVIILYFEKASPGVGEEIALIRSAGRQSSTVVVSSVFAASYDLSDFPTIVRWDDENQNPEALLAAMDAISEKPASKSYAPAAPTPPAPQPPKSIRTEAELVIDAGLELAGWQFRKGKLIDMEDRLAICAAMSFWGDIPEVRAVIWIQMARSQLQRSLKVQAIANLERALDVCERLQSSSTPTKSAMRSLFRDIPRRLSRYKEGRRVAALLARIEAIAVTLLGPRASRALFVFEPQERAGRPRSQEMSPSLKPQPPAKRPATGSSSSAASVANAFAASAGSLSRCA